MSSYEIQQGTTSTHIEANSTEDITGCRQGQLLIIGGHNSCKRTILRAFDDAHVLRLPAKIPHLQRGGLNRWPGKKKSR
jgi:hypothetical protein